MAETVQNQEFIEDNLLVISKQTFELLQAHKDYVYLLALYLFYYNTAKWQKTNQPKCTIEYTAKGCHMNKDTVRKFKKVLINMGLIKDVKVIDSKTGKVVGWYIKLNYIWKQEKVEAIVHPPLSPEGGLNQRVDKEVTNALSVNKQNALSVIENAYTPLPSVSVPKLVSPAKISNDHRLVIFMQESLEEELTPIKYKFNLKCAQSLLSVKSLEQCQKIWVFARSIQGMKGAPRVSSLADLEDHWQDLKDFHSQKSQLMSDAMNFERRGPAHVVQDT